MELKQPMSYEEQLNRLITHGIVVDDRDRAIDLLAVDSQMYFCISGYFLLIFGGIPLYNRRWKICRFIVNIWR